VLVWIPGGAFVGGTAGIPLYDGARLAARGDVVVVTVSYRVGSLGFACLDAEPGEPAVANLGLKDQIAALRWVHEHVAVFGGDPARVTVFGESAGAGSILALTGMPAARGLFARAIVQSAAPRGVIPLADARAREKRWLEELGLAGAPRSALRAVPVEALLVAQAAVIARTPPTNGFWYAPVVDGETLVVPPARAFAEGFARDVPLVIGTTRDEMHLYFAGKPASDDGVVAMIAPQLGLPDAEAQHEARVLIHGFRAARERRGEPRRRATSTSRSRPSSRCATMPCGSPRRAPPIAVRGCTCSAGARPRAAASAGRVTRSTCRSCSATSTRRAWPPSRARDPKRRRSRKR
jgi:para-nitrobenzyl esterase